MPETPPPVFPPARPLRGGQLTVAWQIALGAAWAMVALAFAATWKTSVQLGIGTWWLGPRADPQPIPIRLIPFALTAVVALAAIYNVPRVAAISIAGSLGVAAIALFDTSRSGGLAAIEFAIAGAAILVSLGALTGTYRVRTPRPDDPPPPY